MVVLTFKNKKFTNLISIFPQIFPKTPLNPQIQSSYTPYFSLHLLRSQKISLLGNFFLFFSRFNFYANNFIRMTNWGLLLPSTSFIFAAAMSQSVKKQRKVFNFISKNSAFECEILHAAKLETVAF